MASKNVSLKVNLNNQISDTNIKLQRLLSSRSIPIWINPNNSKYYISNPYKAGDIVILLSNEDEIYFLLRHYYEKIATSLGLNALYFSEKNNPELTDEIINTIINGGYLTEDDYFNPMTIVSTSEKGYGLFVSLKDQNYDIPGASDSWFNLDMSETIDSAQLQISRIISILTSEGYISKLKGQVESDNPDENPYGNENETYLENRLDKHKTEYHFGDEARYSPTDDEVDKASAELDKILEEIESHTNTTSSVMRNPFIMNDEIVGSMITIVQTTGQMFFYCILNTSKLEKDKDITIQFTPNNVSNIIVPFLLNTNRGILEVDNAETDPFVLTSNGENAWYVDSFVKISNDANVSNNITLETNHGFVDANFNNNFNGFMDTAYIATFTPIGVEVRTPNVAIHCSPVREISRTKKSFTFQLSSEYVWKYNGLAIALSGKCEVEAQ